MRSADNSPPGEAQFGSVLSLARRGWRLFPVAQRAKVPLVKNWPSLATADAKTIQNWSEQHPSCNWGLACGPGSGVIVLDVDGDSGKAGLQGLVAQYGPLPTTLTARTGNGEHLYFRAADSNIRNSTGKLGEGLDVRGEGGYVLVPPSVHPSGRLYQWVDPSAQAADAPMWLVRMAKSSRPAPNELRIPPGKRIPQGKGEPAKFALAMTLFKAGASFDEVLAAVLARDARCEHQLGAAECRRKVKEWADWYARREPLTELRSAEIVTLATVQPKDVEWLWRPYLPAGMLSMLSGDPGAGKTYLALAIAAALSTGHVPYSSEICTPSNVIYMSIENDPACVVRPRFDSLGGNPARLHLVRGMVMGAGAESERGAIWLTDIAALRNALDRTRARLMIVDPIQSYLGAEVDAHRSNETRPVLDGLARLAEEHGCCVLLLRHLSKAQSPRAIHRGLGSIDMTGAVRTEMLAGCSPEDRQQRAMVQIKTNLGPYGPALGYTIDEGTGLFSWTGESVLTQSDILAPERAGHEDTAKNEAAEWLRTYLGDGPRAAKEVERAARATGLSWATVRRAKHDAGVKSHKAAFGGGWVWLLAEEVHEAAEDAQSTALSILGNPEHLRESNAIKGEL